MKRIWIITLSILLLTFTLACATLSGKSTQEPTATAAPPSAKDTPSPKQDEGNTPASPTPTVASSTDNGEKPLNIEPDALSGLDSYRLETVWQFTDAEGTTQNFTIDQEATRDPAAQHLVMKSEDGQEIEFIQIEDQQWMRFGDEWMQTTAGADETMQGFGDFFINPEDMLSDINDNDYEDLGKETINGVKTRHLRAKAATWSAFGALSSTDIEKGVVDIWVVDERDLPEFVIRFKMEVEGKVEDETGKLEMSWEVRDINEPITIEPPAEAANMGLPDDIPLCANSSGLTTMGTMTMFSCEGKVADVNDFYTSQLTDLGWEKTESAEVENMFTSSWEKDGETIQLTIMEDEDTGGASVMLVTGE